MITEAQAHALSFIASGHHELVKSGRHLGVLARKGYIVRGNVAGRYVITFAGRLALREWKAAHGFI